MQYFVLKYLASLGSDTNPKTKIATILPVAPCFRLWAPDAYAGFTNYEFSRRYFSGAAACCAFLRAWCNWELLKFGV